jgi:hypothetical protein
VLLVIIGTAVVDTATFSAVIFAYRWFVSDLSAERAAPNTHYLTCDFLHPECRHGTIRGTRYDQKSQSATRAKHITIKL